MIIASASKILVEQRWLDSKVNGLANVLLRVNEKYIANVCPEHTPRLAGSVRYNASHKAWLNTV